MGSWDSSLCFPVVKCMKKIHTWKLKQLGACCKPWTFSFSVPFDLKTRTSSRRKNFPLEGPSPCLPKACLHCTFPTPTPTVHLSQIYVDGKWVWYAQCAQHTTQRMHQFTDIVRPTTPAEMGRDYTVLLYSRTKCVSAWTCSFHLLSIAFTYNCLLRCLFPPAHSDDPTTPLFWYNPLYMNVRKYPEEGSNNTKQIMQTKIVMNCNQNILQCKDALRQCANANHFALEKDIFIQPSPVTWMQRLVASYILKWKSLFFSALPSTSAFISLKNKQWFSFLEGLS